jgi:enoyl-CoA hydratase
MPQPVVLLEKDHGVATVTLNRPEAMNALSAELRVALRQTFERLCDDREVDVVILTGAGRGFCAGLDLKELGGEKLAPPELEGADLDITAPMLRFDRPIIGAINGVAITGGFELALCCDILIGSSEARFADTHARVGIVPGWGLSQKLPRIIGIGRAKELSLTGNYLTAGQALEWGLLNRVVSPDELLPICRQLARDMQSCVPEVMRKIKQIIDQGYWTTLAEGMQIELEASQAHRESVTADMVRERRLGIQDRGRGQVRT